jgi:hypothetical protein
MRATTFNGSSRWASTVTEVERRDGYITWPALLDAGLTHVDILNRGHHDSSEWVVRSASDQALVKIRITLETQIWVVETYVPAEHHPGASPSTHEWLLEDTRTYRGGDVPQMLDDVAAIVG